MWEKVKIGAISKQIRGVSYSPKNILTNLSESGYKILRANNIQDGIIGDLDDFVFIEKSCINESQVLIEGDIIICASSGSKHLVGKAASFTSKIGKYSFGAFCKVLRPSNNVSKRYFHFFFQSPEYRKVISSLSEGANINNIRNEHLDNLEIPLPPLPIQEKVAEILDKADELRRKDQELQAKYDELAQAIFIDMFGDPVKNEKGWKKGFLQDYYKNGVKCGPFGSALKKEEFLDYGIPVWNMDNIQSFEFVDLPRLFVSKEKYLMLKQYEVHEGDIIVSRAGTVGKMCVVNSKHTKSLLSTNLIRLSLNESVIQPLFFVHLMKYFAQRIGRLKTGSEEGFTHMNTGVLDNLEIYIPPLHLQEAFAKKIELINQLKAQTNTAKSEELFQSLLQKAFKGELVTK